MIKGLTDVVQPQFPNLGKLRKGAERVEKTNQKGEKYFTFGRELPYWRFTSERHEIVEAFQAAYGEQPTVIQGYMAYATPEEAFTSWCEIWGATGMVHRCDGETMSIWLENGKYVRGSKPCPGGHDKDDYLSDAVGRLSIIIPELVYAGYVGYVTVETHGKHDILAISRALQAVYESRNGNSQGLHGILFNLRRVPEQVSTPGFGKQEGKRSRVEKWNVKIEPAADWVRLQMDMAHASQMAGALPDPKPAAQLPAGKPEEKKQAEVVTGGRVLVGIEGQQLVDITLDLNPIGEQLWPGVWASVKPKMLKSAKGDTAKVLSFCEERLAHIDEKWTEHVKAAYPEFLELLPEITKVMGTEDYPKLLALQGMALALEVSKTKKSDPFDIVNMIISTIPLDVPVLEGANDEPPF